MYLELYPKAILMKKFTPLLISFLFSITLFAQPVINLITPGSGPIGTAVTIKGTGFSTTPANNIVYFGAVQSVVSGSTDTTVFVTVPAGATFQPVTVTTNNLTAYSTNPFIVTFPGGGGLFTSTSFQPKIDFTTGNYPHSIALADFNGDGKTDVLVSRGSSSTVSVFPNTSSSGSISFGTLLDFPATGNNHEVAATADVDGDGKLDFVLTNNLGNNSVSVFRNTGSGGSISFAPKVDYPVDNSPYSVATGDLNGDGKPDLAIVNSGSNKISVYRNTSTPGNISFAARIDFTVGSSPYSIVIGDINADGKPELAITTQGGSSSLSVMKNTTTGGTISFDAPVDYATFGGPFVVSIGDLDADGKPDLAAAGAGPNSAIVIRNTTVAGNISFAPAQFFTAGNYTVCVSIGDLNGDGAPDLVATNNNSDNVSALKNTSVTGNISFDNHIDYMVGSHPLFAAVGDLDGDGRPDIIAANSSANAISVLRNLIGANLAPTISSFTPTSGVNGTIVTITGTNFTGATDVKFGGTPAASFIINSSTTITATVGAGSSGDVSVTTVYGTATLPGFTFNGPTITSFSPTVGVAGTIVTITGTNFTGTTDVKFGGTPAASFIVNSATSITATVGTGSSGSVSVTTANGTATVPGFSFGVPTIISFTPGSASVGSSVTITGTNFNSTPANNIVFFGAVKAKVTSATSTQLVVIVPAGATYQPITVTNGNLTGYSPLPFYTTFYNDNPQLTVNSYSIAGNFGTGTYPSSVYTCDFDEDSKPDLVIANAVGNSISILRNTSAAGIVSFDPKVDFVTGPGPRRVAIGDLDGDGKPDIVVVNFNSGNASTVSVFRNTCIPGTISFASRTDYATGDGSLAVSIADMNVDGKPDIIVTSGNSGIFSIFKNTTVSPGNISFAPKQDYTLLLHPDFIITADLDKDGMPDIITSNFSNASISVYRNASTGGNLSLGTRVDYSTGANPTYITTGDLDGDGKIDIAVTNYTSGNISFFKNNSSIGLISFGSAQFYSLGTTNISVADLNGDGKLDLCAGMGLSGLISALQNTYTGAGSFSFGHIEFTTGNYDTFVSTGDLDGDNKPELEAVNTILNTVTILKYNISEPEITSLSTATGGTGITVTINGRNFTGTNSVKFGGTDAASFSVISPFKIDAVIGGGASGIITVTAPPGTGSIGGFSFIPEISANGPTTFCSEGMVTLSSSATANNQWYKDGIAINGATATTLQVNTSGTYTVKTTSNGITTTSATGITVTVISVPAPVITVVANGLQSSSATGNQWYFNGNIIPGATNQIYQPTQTGNYAVRCTVNGCTSDFSASFNVIVTGIINLGNGQYIKLFPNPVKKNLNIDWNINGMPVLNIEITDLHGRKLLFYQNIRSGTALDISQFPPGIYFVKIFNSRVKINNTIKIIKEN